MHKFGAMAISSARFQLRHLTQLNFFHKYLKKLNYFLCSEFNQVNKFVTKTDTKLT